MVSTADPERVRCGRTSGQMVEAPHGAVFVWCNNRIGYPRSLALHLGRGDLDIRPLSWLEVRNVCGYSRAAIVVDHAAQLSPRAYEALDDLWRRGVPTYVANDAQRAVVDLVADDAIAGSFQCLEEMRPDEYTDVTTMWD